MAGQFTAVALFLILGGVFVLFNFYLASLIRPKAPNPIKHDIYECGELTTGSAWVQFNIRFYLYALAFVIFDVEAVFLLPWALVYKSLGLFAFIEMLVFLTILIFALWYAWKKGALKWF